MAELATIARPYAEALFKVATQTPGADLDRLAEQVDQIAAVAADPGLLRFSENPRATAAQVFELFASVLKTPLAQPVANFLRAVIGNARVAALPEIAFQFTALKNARSGVSDAIVYSAFPIEPAQWTGLLAALEKKFGRKLQGQVRIDPGLIGGVRVVVGDEVLDTSVRARLAQMKAALTS